MDQPTNRPHRFTGIGVESQALMASICQDLAGIEKDVRRIVAGWDPRDEALPARIPSVMTVLPTQISEEGYAIFGTTTRLEAFKGLSPDDPAWSPKLRVFLVTPPPGQGEQEWRADLSGMEVAKRGAGRLNIKEERREGDDQFWLISDTLIDMTSKRGDTHLLELMAAAVRMGVECHNATIRALSQKNASFGDWSSVKTSSDPVAKPPQGAPEQQQDEAFDVLNNHEHIPLPRPVGARRAPGGEAAGSGGGQASSRPSAWL